MLEPSEREVAVFSAARRLPVAERLGYLDEACAGDAALRQRVEELLRASEEAGGFLQAPAPGAQRPAEALASPNPPKNPVASGEKAGDRIGRYKLLQQIGEGGCGVVYMAEQEEPVRRRVALKVIKLGMDTRQVVARFESERQALALMDHPNIAKVLEAGATDEGRPYFVMELVRGIKITHYCDENNLTTEQRLDLFIKVSQAVQHAHQKGIIHRDLKPSNILVADHDGVPVPKIIDFGIAKATTDQRLTDKTLFTAFEQFVGTPAYMSPEQAKMSGLDIDTRTDIYSLGVLLYELLTGKTPFDAQDLLAAGLDEMRRTISEKEPTRPSTRLSTMLEGELTATAKHRQIDAPKLIHLLSGDLDWIVMKALEKDRTRRYETANGLSIDVQRHLKNEPVLARPPSNFYRFQKLVRRNKLAVAAASAVAATLMIGLAASTWLLFQEREARLHAVAAEKKAQVEASKSQQVAEFHKTMLQGVGPSVALGRDTTMLREILDATAERVGKDLTNQPEVEVELFLTLAETYNDLGLHKQMEGVARQSLQLARTRLGEENENVANSLICLGIALSHLGQLQLGEMHFGKVEEAEKQRRMHDGSLEEAEKCCREGLAINRKLLGNENPKVARALNLLANILATQYKMAEAETLNRESLAMYQKLFGNEHVKVAKLLGELAVFLSYQDNRLAEAEKMNREALAMQRKLLVQDHPDIAHSLFNLAIVLAPQGKWAEAETTYLEVVTMWKKLHANDRIEVADALTHLAEMLRVQGKMPEAETRQGEALAITKRLFGEQHAEVAASLTMLALILRDQGKLAKAEPVYREALAMRRKLLGNEHADVAWSLGILADVLRRQGKLAEAETTYREALAIARKLQGGAYPYLAVFLSGLANVLIEQGKPVEAEALTREALASQRKVLGDRDPSVIETLNSLLGMLLTQRKDTEAEQLLGDFLQPTLEGQPQNISILRMRISFFARRSRWKEAADESIKLVAMDASDDFDQFRLTVLLAQTGDVPGYRARCQKMVASFGAVKDPGPLDKTAKACLLVPEAGFDLETSCRLADQAVTLGKDSVWLHYFQLVKGLAQYRAGQFASAVDWVGKSIGQPATVGETSLDWNRDVAAYSVLAMAQHQLKRSDEASTALAKGVDILNTKLPKLENGAIGEDWADWLIAHILLREAQAVVQLSPATPKE